MTLNNTMTTKETNSLHEFKKIYFILIRNIIIKYYIIYKYLIGESFAEKVRRKGRLKYLIDN